VAGRGIPDYLDIGSNFLAGYHAVDGSERSLWEDPLFPGHVRHPTRATTTYYALVLFTRLTGDIFFSVNLLIFIGHLLKFFAAYAAIFLFTKSRIAGFVSSIIYGFNAAAPVTTLPYLMGYALAPLVLLFLHRTLFGDKPHDPLIYSALLSLAITATLTPFALMLLLANLLYFLLATFTILWRESRRRLFIAISRWGLSIAFFMGLSAHFIIAILLGPVGEASGRISDEVLKTYSSSLFDSILMIPRWASTYGTPSAIYTMTVFILVSLTIYAVLWLRKSPLLQFSLLSIPFIVLTVGLNPPFAEFNRLLWDNIPLLAWFRPTSRPMLITLLTCVFILGILTSRVVSCARAHVHPANKRLERSKILMVLILGLIISSTILYGAYSPQRKIGENLFEIPEAFLEAYHFLGEDEDDFAFAYSPFLLSRTNVPWAESYLQNPHRTIGPAISGKSALGSERVGVVALSSSSSILPEIKSDVHYFSERSVSGGGLFDGKHVLYDGREVNYLIKIGFDSDLEALGNMTLNFIEQGDSYVSLTMDFDVGKIYLYGASENTTSEIATIEVSMKHGIDRVQILFYVGQIWIKYGEDMYRENFYPIPRPRTVELDLCGTKVEWYTVTPIPAIPNPYLAKILALYNTKYFVIPDYVEDYDAQRIFWDFQAGLEPVYEQGGYKILKNAFFHGRFYLTDKAAIMVGDINELLKALAAIPSFRFNETLLVTWETYERLQKEDEAEGLLANFDSLVVYLSEMPETQLDFASLKNLRQFYVIDKYSESGRITDDGKAVSTLFLNLSSLPAGEYRVAALGFFGEIQDSWASYSGGKVPVSELETRHTPDIQGIDGGAHLKWLVSERISLEDEEELEFVVDGASLFTVVKVFVYSDENGNIGTPEDFFGRTTNHGQIIYERIDPSHYSVKIDDYGPGFLVFLEGFNPMWDAKTEASKLQHLEAYGYANAFYLDNVIEDRVVIFFKGQTIANIGYLISISSWFGVTIYLVVLLRNDLRYRLTLLKTKLLRSHHSHKRKGS